MLSVRKMMGDSRRWDAGCWDAWRPQHEKVRLMSIMIRFVFSLPASWLPSFPALWIGKAQTL
jgi:hypothetical protein